MIDPQVQKKRLRTMIAIDLASVAVAGPAAVGAFVYGHQPLVWVMVAAIATGFGAQVWLLQGFIKSNKKG